MQLLVFVSVRMTFCYQHALLSKHLPLSLSLFHLRTHVSSELFFSCGFFLFKFLIKQLVVTILSKQMDGFCFESIHKHRSPNNWQMIFPMVMHYASIPRSYVRLKRLRVPPSHFYGMLLCN